MSVRCQLCDEEEEAEEEEGEEDGGPKHLTVCQWRLMEVTALDVDLWEESRWKE